MNLKKYRYDCSSHTCFKMIKITSLILILILFSCSSALYIPTESQQTASVSLADLQQGRKLYVEKCGSCHSLFLPEKYNKTEWQHWVKLMESKVVINDLEKEKILKYLIKGQ